MNRSLSIVALCLVVVSFVSETLRAEKPKTCSIGGFTGDQCTDTATAAAHNLSLYGQQQMYVAYVNLFRYQFSAQVNSTTVAAAGVPAGLAPSASSTAASTANLGGSGASPQTVERAVPGGSAGAPVPPCDDSALNAGGKEVVTPCWNDLQKRLNGEITNVANHIRKAINESIRNVADEQHCYLILAREFSQPILTQAQAHQLASLAVNNKPGVSLACNQNDNPDWPSKTVDDAWIALVAIQTDLNKLQGASGFGTWANTAGNQAAYTATTVSVTNLITEVVGYATRTSPAGGNANIGQTFTDFQNTRDSNQVFRNILASIASAPGGTADHPENALLMTIPLNSCSEWYGRGRIDTVSLQYTDVTVAAGGSPGSFSLGTNTCLPLSIISTGIGVSFLPNPVYGFVPANNTGTQVIGKTADNDNSPLYGVFYNVKLLPKVHTVELFASPGVGFTSSSNTTTTDILGGLSLSLARRLLFITPSADIGRRDHLAPGFAINTPQGALTSVPTQAKWGVNFMISVSFGIGPTQ